MTARLVITRFTMVAPGRLLGGEELLATASVEVGANIYSYELGCWTFSPHRPARSWSLFLLRRPGRKRQRVWWRHVQTAGGMTPADMAAVQGINRSVMAAYEDERINIEATAS